MSFTWNRKRIEGDADEARSRGRGGVYVNLQDGDKVAGRFMPVAVPAKGEEAELYVRYAQHYLRDIELYVACVDQPTVSEYVPKDWRCPLCALWKELRDSKDSDDQEEAKKYNVSTRYMSNFKIADDGPMKIFRYSVKTQPKIVELCFGTEYGDTLELEDGRDVEIKRKGAALDTDYIVTPVKRVYSIDRKVLRDLHDLYAEIKVLEPKVVKRVLQGSDVVEDEYVTLGELMGGTVPPRQPATDRAPDPEPVARRPRSVASEPAEQPEDRRPTRAEAKLLAKFGDELGLDVDLDNPYAAIVDALVTEAVGTPTKKLSEDLADWLEASGCVVSGKRVERAAPAKPRQGADAGDELSEVERQIQAVRERRAAANKK